MSLNEFDLIKRYFNRNITSKNSGVAVAIGDDCAVLDIPNGYQLAVSTDTLVSGIHFFADVNPYRLGYKALAVNLSDLAAMGALPKWISLAITLPEIDERWLSEFSRGFFALADKFNVTLVGGDTTKGPLSITISVKGLVPRAKALLRSGAKAGELICVSGALGDGGVGLACKTAETAVNNPQIFIDALELTEPRVELGLLLSGRASSCIDISDGLTQDLSHILNSSCCSAKLQLQSLPLSDSLLNELDLGTISADQALQYALTGGDDYELLFTVNAASLEKLRRLDAETRFTVIGSIVKPQTQLIQLFKDKNKVSLSLDGWDHFKD